jgi:hypothetical protein
MALFAKERQLTPSWDLLPASWDLAKKNVWQIVYLSLIPGLILTLGLILFRSFLLNESTAMTSRETWGLIILCIGALLTLLTYPAWTYFLVQTAQGNEVTTLEAFKKGTPRLLPFIGASILAGLAIFFGFILFIIPGLILTRAFFLASYYVIDQKLGSVEALKRSMQESKPVSAWVWGVIGVTIVFALVASFVNYLPVIGYILSLFVAYPYAFAPAFRYTEIARRKHVPFTPAPKAD